MIIFVSARKTAPALRQNTMRQRCFMPGECQFVWFPVKHFLRRLGGEFPGDRFWDYSYVLAYFDLDLRGLV